MQEHRQLTRSNSSIVHNSDWRRYLNGPPNSSPPRSSSAPPFSKHDDVNHAEEVEDGDMSEDWEDEDMSEHGTYSLDLDDCVQCRLPGKFICGRCHGAPSSALLSGVSTSYCSQECQDEHFDYHRATCDILSQRKSLVKVAELLRAIWLKIRAKANHTNIPDVKIKDGELAIYEGDRSRENSGHVLFEGLAPEILEPIEPFIQEQILLVGSSRMAIAVLHKIAENLLQDLDCDYIHEITAPFADPVKHYAKDGTRSGMQEPITHVSLEAKLKDGESWVLDFAAPEIGYRHLILPFREWRVMAEDGYDEFPLGHEAEQFNNITREENLTSIYTNLHYLTLKMIPTALINRLEEHNISLHTLHVERDHDFPQAKETVLQHLDVAIKEWAEFMALPSVMTDIRVIFKEVAVSAMGNQMVEFLLEAMEALEEDNRIGMEAEIVRIFRRRAPITEEDRCIQDIMREIFFG